MSRRDVSIRYFGILTSLMLAVPGALRAESFDPLGYGAAAKAMGGAYTACVEDGSAAYWNPAGLAMMRRPQITSSTEDLYGLGLLRYSVIGYSHPGLGSGAAAFHYLRMETTGEANFLHYAENTYLFAYGCPLWRNIFAGGNLKYHSINADSRGAGFGGDAGLLYRNSSNRFRLGFTYRNLLQPKIRWDTSAEDVLPRSYHLGVGVRLGSASQFTVEETWRQREKQAYAAGMQHLLMKKRLALRAGVRRLETDRQWRFSMGGGFRFARFNFDYAWENDDELGDTQTLSLSYQF
ncbi:MAG TPA: type IX secretion system membrane protein PorP/SprF [Elusimicrobiota bacterium]|nr:type IX secretion system membrane protein PorP/SprF [Elusimicrobiota bacterium]